VQNVNNSAPFDRTRAQTSEYLRPLSPTAEIFGRDDEVAKFVRAHAGFQAAGHGTILVEVVGDPGVGKTTLLKAFAGIARKYSDTTVLDGRVHPHPHSSEFAVFTDAFSHLYDSFRATTAKTGIHHQAVLAAIFPDRFEADGQTPKPSWPSLMRHCRTAIYRFIEQLPTDNVVIVLDEMERADAASLQILSDMLNWPPAKPMMFIVGYRDRQAGVMLTSTLESRSRLNAATTLYVRALSDRDIDDIVDHRGTARWRSQLFQDSEGNPAYLMTLLAERAPLSSVPVRSETGARARLGHYSSFLAELERVGPELRDIAYSAAVIGDPFDAELVARILDQTETDVLGGIGDLIRADLVRPVAPGSFAFRHPVVRRAVYLSNELSTRVLMHRRADDALRSRGLSDVARAPHVEQWVTYGDLDAIEVLDSAAAEVVETRPITAAAWLTSALRVLPQPLKMNANRVRLLVRLAKAQAAGGQLRECRATMHQALRLLPEKPEADHAAAVAFIAMVQRLLGAHAESEAMLWAEIPQVSDTSTASAQLKFELAACRLKNGDSVGSQRWANEALLAATRHGDSNLLMSCLGLLAKAGAVDGDTAVAATFVEQATGILDRMLDSEFAGSLKVVDLIGWSEVVLERWDDALRHFSKGVEFAARAGHRLTLPYLLTGQVFVLRTLGKLAEAATAAEHAVELAAQSGSPEQLVSAHSMHAWTDTMMDNLESAIGHGQIAIEQAQETTTGWRDALALRVLAEARLLSGDHEGCLAVVAAAGGPNLPTASPYTRVAWYELLTRAELAGNRPDAAAAWARSCAACAERLDQPGRTGLALLAEAEVALAVNPESALWPAEGATAALQKAGMAVDGLRAKICVGVAHWYQGDRDGAVRDLKYAESALDELGASVLAKLARTERRRLAAKSPRERDVDNDGNTDLLTIREGQVAELVREGLTNRMISRKLHISEKTVEMHLSKVFVKLGVRNRTAVAALLSQEPPTALHDHGA